MRSGGPWRAVRIDSRRRDLATAFVTVSRALNANGTIGTGGGRTGPPPLAAYFRHPRERPSAKTADSAAPSRWHCGRNEGSPTTVGARSAGTPSQEDLAMMNEAVAGPVAVVPRKLVYAVTEKGEKSFWTKIGMAFVNRDGSLTVRLDAMPMNGVLQIRDEDPMRRPGSGGGM